MKVSLVIATRNRSAALAATLASLQHVARPDGCQAELIVADNGSTDATTATASLTPLALGPVVVVSEPRPGKANALNTAVARAGGDILVFLDDDVRVAPDWLAELLAPLARGDADAVSGRIDIAPHLLRPWMTAAVRGWLASTEYLDRDRPDAAIGANMAVTRRVLETVPQFDPELGPGRLGFWEDTLFSFQLRRAGFRLAFAPAARVEHHFDPDRLSRASLLAHAVKLGRSSAYVAWHWNHDSARGATRDALHFRLRLAAKRLVRRRDWQRTEGIAPWEMNLACGIAYADQLRTERARPRAYSRFGPVKRRTAPASAA